MLLLAPEDLLQSDSSWLQGWQPKPAHKLEKRRERGRIDSSPPDQHHSYYMGICVLVTNHFSIKKNKIDTRAYDLGISRTDICKNLMLM